MKPIFRFSIGFLLVVIAMIAGFLTGYQGFRIPSKFEGVWIVTAVVENGVDLPLSRDGSGNSGGFSEWMEIHLQSNRMTMVSVDGQGDVAELKPSRSGNRSEFESRWIGTGGIDEDPLNVSLKRTGQTITVVLAAPVDSPKQEDVERVVITAIRNAAER